jgi:ribonucleoside-diphosphate reductase alpha chain
VLNLAKENYPAPVLAQMFVFTDQMLEKRPEMKADCMKVGDKIKGAVLHATYCGRKP